MIEDYAEKRLMWKKSLSKFILCIEVIKKLFHRYEIYNLSQNFL